MTKQDKMKINNLLVRIKQIEDEIERLRLFDNQIEANYNRVFDYGVTNRIMLDEQCRKIGDLKAENEQLKEKLNARLTCDFVKTAQKQAKIEAVKEFAEKLKDYINDKIIEEFFDMAVGIKYFTIDIDEFKEYVDELLKEYE